MPPVPWATRRARVRVHSDADQGLGTPTGRADSAGLESRRTPTSTIRTGSWCSEDRQPADPDGAFTQHDDAAGHEVLLDGRKIRHSQVHQLFDSPPLGASDQDERRDDALVRARMVPKSASADTTTRGSSRATARMRSSVAVSS